MRSRLIAGVLVVGLLVAGAGLVSQGSATPVVLIVLESTRADHIGPCYGYERRTAPELCELAEDAVLFEQAYSQGSNTHTAVPSLLSGRSPSRVAITDFNQTMAAATIPSVLSGAGYRTTVNTESPQTFARLYDRRVPLQNISFPAGPRFTTVFLRYWAHFPYAPAPAARRWSDINMTGEQLASYSGPEGVRELLDRITEEQLTALYDADIRTGDMVVGKLIERMRRAGTYRESMIIVTADHGESLGENGWYGHSHMPRSWEVRVPLVIKFPGNRFAGRRVEARVRHVDVLPTVLDVLGIDGPEDLRGRSVLPLLRGEEHGDRPAVAAVHPVINWTVFQGGDRLSARRADTFCRQAAYREADRTRRRLGATLCDWFLEGVEGRNMSSIDLSERQLRRLRELGYLE